MTKIRAVFPLLVVAMLLLSGCFRQADDSFEPVSVDGETPAGDTDTAQSTSDVPVFTLEPTADDGGVDDTASTGPTATLPLVMTVAVTNTPPPVSIVTTTPEESGTDFITPGAPPGLIVTNTPDPNASPTSAPTSASDEDGDGEDTEVSTDPTLSALTTPENVDPDCIYTIRSGDTLYRIALSNGTSVDRILAVNPELGAGTFILPGDEIVLPDCEPDGDGDTTPEPTARVTESAPTEGTIHRVSSGETLYAIAIRYGVTVNSIINANPDLGDPNRLRIGQELVIPTD